MARLLVWLYHKYVMNMCQLGDFKRINLNSFYIGSVWKNLKKLHNSQALASQQSDEILAHLKLFSTDHIVRIFTECNKGTVLVNFLGKVHCEACYQVRTPMLYYT